MAEQAAAKAGVREAEDLYQAGEPARALREEVLVVLREAARTGEGGWPFISSFQVLERLPEETRRRLVERYGRPGLGGGNQFSAAGAVARTLSPLVRPSSTAGPGEEVEVVYMDTRDVKFVVGGGAVQSGFTHVALWRMAR